jgi:hypothetical protein
MLQRQIPIEMKLLDQAAYILSVITRLPNVALDRLVLKLLVQRSSLGRVWRLVDLIEGQGVMHIYNQLQ